MLIKSILGIDVGGTGIKAALVDPSTGEMLTEKLKILTPKPATPASVSVIIQECLRKFDYQGPVGCGFPSVIMNDIAITATNLDKSWINTPISKLFSEVTGQPFYVINDADAAGLAEMNFGAAKGIKGTVIMITIGTGVGSGIFINGALVPNTELGFLPMKGDIAERRISNVARKRSHLNWLAFGKRLNDYLTLVERLFNPEIIVVGGGICKKWEFFSKHILINTKVTPALLQNNAGCIGAAYYAHLQEVTAGF
ncbi:MAG: ROK family protein [Saprospiraceae bacterium]|nr:ROK family protein [Saprospiraceae bacterium]